MADDVTSDIPGARIAAVRGAVSVARNEREAILEATARLLNELVEINRLDPGRIVSAVFTATEDLDADFPAHAARRIGWVDVPLLGAREIAVPGAMPRIIRVLLTVSEVPAGTRLVPVYLDEAAALRPDLARPDASQGPSPAAPARRVALIGLGQIGGSIGLSLGKRGGWWRVGHDRAPSVLEEAVRRGAIDQASDSLEAACERADLAVLAVPVDALPAVIEQASKALPSGAALVDTGSARVGITPALEQAASRGVRVVGGHPIAGTEGHGIPAARADMFRGFPFALMSVGGEVPAIVSALVEDLGAQPVLASPAAHDRALARTSHLPYVVSCALHTLGEDAARAGLSGPGFRDMTRLAASDAESTLAYCRRNAQEVAAAWQELRGIIDARVASLTPGQAEGRPKTTA